MSMTTPPGWYQDPSAPTQERWWDGNAWSAHTRAPGQPQQAPQTPAAPQYGYPQQQPQQQQGYGFPPAPAQPGVPAPPAAPPGSGGGGGGLGKGGLIAVITAGVVLVAAIVTGVVVLGGEDDPKPPPVAATTPPVPGGSSAPTPPPATTNPSADASVLADQLNGITLPILDGWEIPEFGGDREAASMQTKESYDCPGERGFCFHGAVTSRTAPTGQTTPEAVAKADISQATELAYGKDVLDRQKYGGIKSHQEVKAEAVTVAGKQGYLVRWKVVTGKGPGGYVQSLAFPSSMGPSSIVLVRFSFDAGPDGPPLDGMDKITQGIRNAT
ncbi:hypothetical protein GCM10010329_72570 [Streptomyces spiroverticillatus]|uniref:DUF2510 domain-containing protein n=1 Tax=Streptomyces finlayi TaxID=67296 RepID=A0A918X0Q7_9ACTN|nr:DUF2510 domain-containing protein [Streptomyces finlayi]GHA38925.1 hypothetical protein GCM10010329_72570 [Streptomyces spiroverticillatus]GHD00928.1 hypothetical protein GCM10010334_45990 [Streptomyces finlayi]